MAKKLSKLALRLRSLTVFRDLLDDPVLAALVRCLERTSGGDRFVPAYGEFVSRLYQAGYVSITNYIRDLVFDSDNVYIRLQGAGTLPDKLLIDGAVLDLETLSDAGALDADRLLGEAGCSLPLARFEGKKVNLTNEYGERAKEISRYGYGIYARYRAFCLDGGKIVPVKNPDPVRLGDLVDYQREKDIIIGNTLALLEGKPAANMLLTGDAGTGSNGDIKQCATVLYSGTRPVRPCALAEIKRIPKYQLHKPFLAVHARPLPLTTRKG